MLTNGHSPYKQKILNITVVENDLKYNTSAKAAKVKVRKVIFYPCQFLFYIVFAMLENYILKNW